MDLKSRLLEDIDAEESRKKIESDNRDKRQKEEDSLRDRMLRKAEKYYVGHAHPALMQVNETMGGRGPNPDGSLPWRGGRGWTLNPEHSAKDEVVEITGSVVWDVRHQSGRGGGTTIIDGGLQITVDSSGMAFCMKADSRNNAIQVNLLEPDADEKLNDACYQVIKDINHGRERPYIPGHSKPIIPLDVIKERTEKTRQTFVLPLFRQLAQRYGVSMSQDPYIGFKLFTGEYSSQVPVRPGFKDDTLIIRILSWVGNDPTEAIAISISANEHTVYISGKNFDVTTQGGVNSLWKFAFQYAATQPRETFACPSDDHGWDGM